MRQKLLFESFSERVLEALPAAEGYSACWRGRFGGSSSRRGAFDERLVQARCFIMMQMSVSPRRGAFDERLV